jgi:hypothetical protein
MTWGRATGWRRSTPRGSARAGCRSLQPLQAGWSHPWHRWRNKAPAPRHKTVALKPWFSGELRSQNQNDLQDNTTQHRAYIAPHPPTARRWGKGDTTPTTGAPCSHLIPQYIWGARCKTGSRGLHASGMRPPGDGIPLQYLTPPRAHDSLWVNPPWLPGFICYHNVVPAKIYSSFYRCNLHVVSTTLCIVLHAAVFTETCAKQPSFPNALADGRATWKVLFVSKT